MSLTASMWTGVSGLLVHGEKMNVLGNNIANVNTVGFKGARMDFEDFINQDTYSAAGVTQVGRGASIGAIYADHSQGAFESTNESTDLAIGGKGFFQVKPKGEDTAYYTRAGNFRFDNDGYLTDPHGYVLQGWQIERTKNTLVTSAVAATSTSSKIKGSGVPVDIRLDGFTADPQHTQNVTMALNLDSRPGGDNTRIAGPPTQPYTALFQAWNGTANPPIGSSAFAYQNTIKVYDEAGTAHNLTVYLDQVASTDVTNATPGQKQWEYIVTVPPSEDNRMYDDPAALPPVVGGKLNTTSKGGVLMMGTLTFDSAGQLVNQTAFSYKGNTTVAAGANPSGDPTSLANWEPTKISTNGYPLMVANFSGVAGANSVGSADATPYLMELNFGLKNTNLATPWTPATANASLIGNDNNALPQMSSTQRQSTTTTSYSGASSTTFQKQDGYTFGFLQNVTVDRDGIMRGKYSNGVTLDLYQVTLYDFSSKQNLRREGGNLFSETRESGDPLPGPANGNGLGTINSNSLEQSNVDLSKEFVQMITTQRGFQSNSKVITTTDTMLETVVNMKR